MNLKQQINKELQELRGIYLKSIEDHAKDEFLYLSTLTEEKVINQKGYLGKNRRGEEVMLRSKASVSYWNKVTSIVYKGLDKYIEKQIKVAELNFEGIQDKIYKKACDKGLFIQNCCAIYYRVGNDNNPQLEVTDGIRTVFCYTIIAEGDIQKAHYRFLIK